MPDPSNQTPEPRIKELEQQLALMSKKAQLFEAVIDVLEKRLRHFHRKKATRQVLSQLQVDRLTIASRQAYYKAPSGR